MSNGVSKLVVQFMVVHVAIYFNQASVDNVDTTTVYNHRLYIYICHQECIIKRKSVCPTVCMVPTTADVVQV